MDKAFLESSLVAGMSLPEIGRLVGRPPGTVGYWVRKYGLVANGSERFGRKAAIDRTELSGLVSRGLSVAQIAAHLDIPSTRVRYWIAKHALGKTRGASRQEVIRLARAEGVKEVMLECPVHGITAYWIGETRSRCRKCNSGGVSRRRRRVKQVLVDEAGGRCVICGYDRSPVALEFHHLDRREKSFALSQAGITRAIEAARAEAAKCVLLCANCHAEVEAGLARVPV